MPIETERPFLDEDNMTSDSATAVASQQSIKAYVDNNAGGQTLYECVVAPSGGDYTSLYDAINAGKTRIFIRNGTYTETTRPVIASNMVIVGESMENTIIDVTTVDYIGVANTAAEVEISNLTVSHDSGNGYNIDQGSDSGDKAYKWTLERVRFVNGGIRLGYPENSGQCYDIKFSNCEWTGTSAGNTAAVELKGDTDTDLGYFHFVGNKVTGAYYGGFYLRADNHEVLVADNILRRSSFGGSLAGVDVDEQPNKITITGNQFENWDGNGALNIGAALAEGLVISGNVFYNNDRGVFINQSYGAVISGNTFRSNADTSIGLNNGDNNVISGNLFIDEDEAIKFTSNNENCLVTGNRFQNCTTRITDSGAGTANVVDRSNLGLLPTEMQEFIYVQNTDGDALAAGDVVVLKAAANGYEVAHTTTAGDNLVLGMAEEAIANNAYGHIQVWGKTTKLKVDGTDDIAVGDLLSTFTTEGIAQKAASGEMAFAMALEAYTTDDSSGVIDALLITPRQMT